MTYKDLETELEKDPFIPLRLHLVSGKVVRVPAPGVAWLFQNAVLIFQNVKPGRVGIGGYDVIAMRNIERVEQVISRRGNGARG